MKLTLTTIALVTSIFIAPLGHCTEVKKIPNEIKEENKKLDVVENELTEYQKNLKDLRDQRKAAYNKLSEEAKKQLKEKHKSPKKKKGNKQNKKAADDVLQSDDIL